MLLCLTIPAVAAPTPLAVRTLADPVRAQLCRGQQVVLEIEGGTAQDGQRAVTLVARPDLPFRVTTSTDRALLWSGPDLLAEITRTQAARWATTPYSLARTFASRLEEARSGKTPSLPTLDPPRLTVPLGETRPARWLNVAGTPTIAVSDTSVAAVQVADREIRVTGRARGEATITLSWPQTSLVLPVTVRPWAARLPATLEVPTSGGMANEEALLRVLLGRAALHPAARLELTLPPGTAPDKPIAVQAWASGPDLLEARSRIQVRFVPTAVEISQAGGLVVSNRPEKVEATGTLLRQALPTAPVRLLVHHRNAPGAPERFLEVLLRNHSNAQARVFVVLAGVGPSQDEIFAGHLAARRFLEALQARKGVTLTLEPGETLLLERLRMKPGQTVSAMGWLQPGRDDILEVTVRAVDGQGEAPDQDLADPGPGPFPTGRGYFPPEMQAAYAHDIGSRFTFIPLGDAPFTSDAATGELNPGNFGVVQRLQIVLRNPTDQAREARLDFHPRGGPARGLFYVDGALVETPMATAASPSRLGRWTLAPGEVREVRLETFPQSGSNYPINIEVHSDFLNLPPAPAPQVGPLQPFWLP